MNDVTTINMVYFKGIDTDNNGTISADELATLYEINGIDKEEDEIIQLIHQEAQGAEELTFPQFMHLMYNMDIDAKIDIYQDRKRKNGFNGRFEKLWKEFDKDESNGLDLSEFKSFILSITTFPMTEDQCEFYYYGLDIDGKGFVNKKQCRKLQKAMAQNDRLELNKILFRGIDADNSNKIELQEFLNLSRINGSPLSELEGQEIIRQLSNGGTSISFAQFYSYTEGKQIPEDTQAYTPKQLEKIAKNAEEDKKFEEIWSSIDTEALGYLDYDGFKEFLVAYGHNDAREVLYEHLFQGTDVNNNAEISKSEMRSLIKAAMSRDIKFMSKLFFRAADDNRDGLIDTNEYCDFMSALGKKVTVEDAIAEFQKVGATDAITYSQCVKLSANIDIPEDEDAYDGEMSPVLSEFNKLFNELDVDDSNYLDYDEFKEFLVQFVAPDMSELQCECYFKGADLERNNKVSWWELWRLAKALRKNDLLYMNKLFFRGMDKTKTSRVTAKDFKTLADLNQVDMTKAESREKFAELANGQDTISFTQAVNYLTGMQIDVEIDPYVKDLKKQTEFLTRYDKVWDELVPKGGEMDKEKFVWAILDLAQNRMTDEQVDIWFSGTDSNDDQLISKEEFRLLYTALAENDTQAINEISYKGIEKMKVTSKEEKLGMFYRVNNFCKEEEEIAEEAENIPDSFGFVDVYEHVTMNKFKENERVFDFKTPCCSFSCSCKRLCGSSKVSAEEEQPLIEGESNSGRKNQVLGSPALRFTEIAFSCIGFIALILMFVCTMIPYNHFDLSKGEIVRKIKPKDFGSLDYQALNPVLESKQFAIGIMVISFCSCIIEITSAMLLLFGEEGSAAYRMIGGPLIRGITYIFVATAFIGFNLKFSLATSIITYIAAAGLIATGIWKLASTPKAAK